MHPPTLHPVDQTAGLYVAEKITKSGWPLQTAAVSLDGGGVLLYSPTRGLGEGVYGALAEVGPVEALVAPSHFHYLGLPRYAEKYPEAIAVTSSAAMPRVGKKLGGACPTLSPLEALEERLPGHISILSPPGLKTGEVWLRVETGDGVAWVVCDAFFNVDRPVSGLAGFITKVTKTRPGLCIGQTWHLLHMKDKAAYRAWLLERIQADRPTALIPSHGEVARGDDLADRLEALARERLR